VTRARDESLLRQRRKELGMSVTELADAIGRTAASVSMMEGGFVPAEQRQRQLARVLQTTPQALWPEEYEWETQP
jgi:transcriptional regulator with XRE-family HTH domain